MEAVVKVLFDGFWWFQGPASNRQVQRDIIKSWAATFPADEIAVAVPSRDLAKFGDVELDAQILGTHLGQHALAATFELPRLCRQANADLVFSHNFTPWSGPSATFIHDVLFQTNQEWFTAPERAYFSNIPRLAKRASVVLTSSRSEAGRIMGMNPSLRHVEAIGLAVGTEIATVTPKAVALPGTASEFVLSVGRLNVRKNLSATLEAAMLSGAISGATPLVVVGEPDGRVEHMSPQVRAGVDSNSIIFLGRISDAELAWLYSNARALLFLSLGEGFGLPQLEARHFGCPILLSDLSVFREVSGPGAVYCDPLDVAGMAQAIAEVTKRGRLTAGPGVPLTTTWDQVVQRARDAIVRYQEVEEVDVREGIRIPPLPEPRRAHYDADRGSEVISLAGEQQPLDA
jgi:glycosyltransferase involved in cell wall biosynthesis